MEVNVNDFIYIGLVLSEETKDYLLNLFHLDSDFWGKAIYKIYCHHCTLLHKSMADTEKGQRILNELKHYNENDVIPIVIDGIGVSDKAMAFRVQKNMLLDIICMNEQPHITIATFNDGKPVDSNYIKSFMSVPPITIKTKLQIYKKWKNT